MHAPKFSLQSLLLVSTALSILAASAVSQAATADCYVDANATGGDGSSWPQAFTSLQAALTDVGCSEIWVAEGTYKTTETTDREVSFDLPAGVKVYGGFSGNESARDERDWVNNLTTLSGDINQSGNPYDNSCHIVDASAADESSLLDGFTITSTFSDSCASTNGGGIYSNGGSGRFENLILTNLEVFGSGAGAWLAGGNPRISNTTFLDNYAWGSGGGLATATSDAIVERSTFTGNASGEIVGGGAYLNGGAPLFVNVTFSGNISHGGSGLPDGGGIYISSGTPMLTNVTFSGNSADETDDGKGDAIFNQGELTLINVLIDEAGPSGACHNEAGGTVTAESRNNLIHDSLSSCGLSDGVNGNIVGLDPMLEPLAENESNTQTHALSHGSPAKNTASSLGCPPQDQRGLKRPQDSQCDIGAYEVFGKFLFQDSFRQVEAISVVLNDTGIDWCSDISTNDLSCPTTGYEGQDGDHGRDAQARAGGLDKIGSGAGGFDFTKIDLNGNDLPTSASEWSCVRDNHTGLIWEVKTADGGLHDKNHTYTWYNPDATNNGGDSGVQNGGNCSESICDTSGFLQAVNERTLCGVSGWRVPGQLELRTIVDYGSIDPVIDVDFFPQTDPAWFWSSLPSASDSTKAKGIGFHSGGEFHAAKSDAYYLRLVNDGYQN